MKARLAGLTVIGGLWLALAAPASATTFCVPNFHAACPNNGTNVEQADLDAAMKTNGSDGIADTIRIAGVTLTNPAVNGSFDVMGASDALEIVGAGPGTGAGATRLTSASTANIYVVDLFGARTVTIRDLTIVVPASIPAGNGAGAQVRGGTTVENVDFESQGVSHGTGILFNGGGSYDRGAVYGAGGGSFGYRGVDTNAVAANPLVLSRLTISDTSTGVAATVSTIPITVRRSRINAPVQIGVSASGSGIATVENVVITDPGVDGVGVHSNSASSPSATVRHTTVARVTGFMNANPLEVSVQNAMGNGNATLTATGVIIRGFTSSYLRQAPMDPAGGNANLTLTYSNFGPGTSIGDGTATLTPGNIDQDPLFTGATDFHLLAGSPSIDTADPMPAVAVNEDFDGLPRPVDGNADSIARRDMGAYEYQLPSPPPSGGGSTPVVTTPIITAPTGQRAAALKKCKKKRGKARKKCKKAANRLPV